MSKIKINGKEFLVNEEDIVRNRLSGFARAGVVVRPAVSYGGKSLNPFSFVGSLVLLGATVAVLMLLLKVVMG